jgi:hypothetical protein
MNLALYFVQTLYIMVEKRGYQPDVRHDHGTFGNVVPVMDVVLSDTVGKT